MRLPPVSAGFRRLAQLRDARVFHPVGLVGQGRLQLRDEESAPGQALGPGEHQATVRFSRGVGLSSAGPDFLGIAVRVTAPDGTPFDLLLTTTAHAGWARWMVLPARRWTSRPYSTVLPYDTPTGKTLIVLMPIADRSAEGSLQALAEVSAQHPLTFDVLESHGRWANVGRLVVDGFGADQSIPFDPMLHARRGLRPVRFLAGLREAAYRGSRRGRRT